MTLLWLVLFFLPLIFITPILGSYIANLFSGKKTFLHPYMGWLERLSYSMCDINPETEMTWKEYGRALLLFNFWGFFTLFFLVLFQGFLPLNPQAFSAVDGPLAFNIAISFVTNTNWQSYAGETTLSYLTQMVGLTSQQFLSAATGMAALLVLIRGISRKKMETVGNFWVDLVRSVVYLLLPLSIILSLFLVGQGVIQTLSPYNKIITLDNSEQIIPLGPVASQVAIKQLGSNGGGFFNANSAHPFENPTPLSNIMEMWAILLIPAASVYAYGIMIASKRQGWMLLSVMFALLSGAITISFLSEHTDNPLLDVHPIMEGKEVRFGIGNSVLWSMTTTVTSNGSINAMLSSLSPLAGGMAMFNMMLGELIFGGVGVGLCSMIMLILLTVFLSGLMVGRTPEYMGKKIEQSEMLWVVMAVLLPGALSLVGAGVSSILPEGVISIGNKGPHGLSEVLYAFTSVSGNNGSAFSSLNANSDYYNIALGLTMLAGRISIILPSLAIAGSLALKKVTPASIGTFSTSSPLFAFLLVSVIIIVSALTFFPALSLGPITEHLLMRAGRSF